MTTHITITGNLGTDPEMRFTPTGAPVMSVNVAVVNRKKVDNKWVDDNTTWYRVIAWRYLAEHVAESLHSGMRVIVSGSLINREWETREGEKRYTLEITADSMGPDLAFATVSVHKATRETAPLPDDPWANGSGNETAESGETTETALTAETDISNESAGQKARRVSKSK